MMLVFHSVGQSIWFSVGLFSFTPDTCQNQIRIKSPKIADDEMPGQQGLTNTCVTRPLFHAQLKWVFYGRSER